MLTQSIISDPFFLFSDLESSPVGMPQMYANLSKNATVPNMVGGILWEDTLNKRIYMYGGDSYGTPPSPFYLYAYDIMCNHWDSFGPPTGAASIIPTSWGAGVSIPERGEAYYYGGFFSNLSAPGWTGKTLTRY